MFSLVYITIRLSRIGPEISRPLTICAKRLNPIFHRSMGMSISAFFSNSLLETLFLFLLLKMFVTIFLRSYYFYIIHENILLILLHNLTIRVDTKIKKNYGDGIHVINIHFKFIKLTIKH